MTRGNILTEEEIARLAALPEKQRDYAVKIYAAREKKKSPANNHLLSLPLQSLPSTQEEKRRNPQPTSSGSSSPSTTSTSAIP